MRNRGEVKKISFEIEYPDGTKKLAVLEKELETLTAIILHDSQVTEKLQSDWGGSDNWKDNPTMLLVDVEDRSTPYCRWKHHQIVWDEGGNPK